MLCHISALTELDKKLEQLDYLCPTICVISKILSEIHIKSDLVFQFKRISCGEIITLWENSEIFAKHKDQKERSKATVSVSYEPVFNQWK